MEFPRRRLLMVCEELGEGDLAALKFLSRGHIPMRKLEAIQKAQDFFEALQEKGMIEEENLFFLKELLYRIRRIDLLESRLGTSRQEMERELQIPGRAKVSPYRYLLFQLSEDITEPELKSFKFLLGQELPKCRLIPKATMLDVFTEMEKKGILGEDNLSVLKSLCAEIDISLLKTIEEYELKFGEEEMVVTEAQRGSTGGTEAHNRYLASSVAPDFPDRQNETSQVQAYKMTSRPRGVCLILNNHSFAKARERVPELKDMNDRTGTDVDAGALKRVFSKLHFTIAEYRDLTAEEIRKTVNIYRCEDHKDKDCFVCCILSHGKKGMIYGVDGQEVPIRELTTSFTGQNCYSLAGKPKVFFVQACQGDACQEGVNIETDSKEPDDSVETDARFQFECIPTEADFLLGMATLQDYVSYRSPYHGTWYIQALCHHLEHSCPRGEDILTILTAVNREVSKKTCQPNSRKQMPQPTFTLRKRLIFPVN
ncbi:caspase-8 isoform X1 [Pezoporus wallicus]|uniref:caspase-8 isoform X1 n=2 Tax=Pezoporus wallicus TaxID=35540 RepID=UPI00254D1864|nr:caspase-8 isoform X1 [Pezoporus wallicus]XP_061312205.1 caspase-8 isoform X1 [Pezoporus flaviventris]